MTKPELPHAPIIEAFLRRYSREIDYHRWNASRVQLQIDSALKANGIRAITSSRAKQLDRLRVKLNERAAKKKYADEDSIRADIVDLAGVRVALYFPSERATVDALVRANFVQRDAERLFPIEDAGGRGQSSYVPRFAGYVATHHRVSIRLDTLADEEREHADGLVEVQVASVLMHAWAEVEHDLVYKPLAGTLSESEYMLLDQINGLVLAGELALVQLQAAQRDRLRHNDTIQFSNHYDLAAFLFDHAQRRFQTAASPEMLGSVDILFDFLTRAALLEPAMLEPYLEMVAPDLDQRPLVNQIVESMLRVRPELYPQYEASRESKGSVEPPIAQDGPVHRPDAAKVVHEFISNWVELERLLMSAAQPDRAGRTRFSWQDVRKLAAGGAISRDDMQLLERLRRIRNVVLHETRVETAAELVASSDELRALVARMEKTLRRPHPA